MKIEIFKENMRGVTKNSWLKSFHSFSFADYYDPQKISAGALRVLNDDIIKPKSGFGAHSHRDMEIVTIMLKGKLTHEDNLGNKETLSVGEIQVMSAGTGITHSEYNNEDEEDVELLQIWVEPGERNLKPRYEQKVFLESNNEDERENKWQIIASPNIKGTLKINQDAYFSRTNLKKSSRIYYKLHDKNHSVYVFIIEGSINISNVVLNRRDAVFITETNEFIIETNENYENNLILIIEVPLLA